MAMSLHMASASFEVCSSDPTVAYENCEVKKASTAFENAISMFRKSQKDEEKKTLFGKILKLLTLKATESKRLEKARKQHRQRRRSSSTPSNIEIMPTIYEETETDLYTFDASMSSSSAFANSASTMIACA